MNKVREFFRNLAHEINLSDYFRIGLLTLAMVLFFASLANIAGMLYETRATKGIVFSKDNDAGRGIQTATLTRWWNSNHFAPYGNLYFRVAHTIAKISPSVPPAGYDEKETEEIVHHFALLLTSLLFLGSLCVFLGFRLTGSWAGALWMGNIFLHLGAMNPTWVEFLFRVHPDHMLMFFCLVSCYFTLKYSDSKSRRDFILAALFWGIATAVKRSTVLFIPAFVYLFLSDGIKKESFIRGVHFIGYMLLAYLIIGFPQNFSFYKAIKFMYIETYNSKPATMASAQEYLTLIWNQSKWLWLAMIPAHFLFGTRENILNRRYVIFCILALLVVLSGSMTSNHNHHIMPHVAMFFVLFIYLLKKFPVIHFPRKEIALPVLAMITLFFVNDLNSALLHRKDMQMDCRKEAGDALEIVKASQAQGKLLVRDPYFPFSSQFPDFTKQIWGMNGEILDKENAGLWGTKRDFLIRLRTKPYRPHIYPDLTLEQWNAKLALALLVQTESSFTTPKGSVFEKIYDDRCGYMIWKKKE